MNKNKLGSIMMLTSLLTGFFFTILLIVLIFDFNTTKFKLSKLEKYIIKENNYLSVGKYYNTNIKTTEDTITISFSNDKKSGSLKGTLNNNILTFKIPIEDENILLKGKLVSSVADSIGQLNGNKKGYMSTVLGSIDYSKINLKDNGLEVYKDGENNIYKFHVDKKFVLGSIADVYFSEDDLNEFNNKMKTDDYFQTTKGNLILYKIEENDKIIFYLAEPDQITSRTYNSVLSLISVMYDNNTSDLFSKAFKKLTTTTWNEMNFQVNYVPKEEEVIYNKLPEDYKILKLELNQ